MKVMTLLMTALILSVSGCFKENEMSSPEGTVKGFYRAYNQKNVRKMMNYCDPSGRTEGYRKVPQFKRQYQVYTSVEVVKTTLVSKKESLVWKGDNWGNRTWATVEASVRKSDSKQIIIIRPIRLVMLNNKWYIEHFSKVLLKAGEVDEPRVGPLFGR